MRSRSLRLASFMYSAVSFLIRRSAWCIMFSLQICLSTPLEVWSTSSNTGFDGADRALVIRSMVWITELQVLIYVKIILFTANVPGAWPQLTQDTVRPNKSHCLMKPWARVIIARSPQMGENCTLLAVFCDNEPKFQS